MSWNTFYKGFSLTVVVNLTTTKLLAWAIFVVSILLLGYFPKADRTTFLISAWGISAALYGVKTLSDFKQAKLKNESYPDDNNQL